MYSNRISILLFLCLIGCQNTEIDISENIHVSKEWPEYPHAEVHLAVNPNDGQQMIAAAFAYKESGGKDYPAAYISSDGGKSWSRIDVESPETGAADPWVLYQKDRIIYMHTSGMAHVSLDNGQTWSSKRVIQKMHSLDFIKIVGIESDQEFYAIATNNLPTKNGPTIDPVTVFQISNEIEVKDSLQILPDSINYKNGVPIITDENLLIVPFYELLDRNRDLLGKYPIWLAHINLEKFEIVDLIKTPLEGGEISMAIDPFTNRIHIVNPTIVGEGFELTYAYSDDLGYTWSKPKLIEDFERDPGSVILTASISISSDGVLGILWPDHRTDPQNEEYGMYFMYSRDGGETFSNSYLISEISSPKTKKNMRMMISDSNRPVGDRFWVGGDYYGLVSVDESSFQAAWVDSRKGIAQVWTTRVTIK